MYYDFRSVPLAERTEERNRKLLIRILSEWITLRTNAPKVNKQADQGFWSNTYNGTDL